MCSRNLATRWELGYLAAGSGEVVRGVEEESRLDFLVGLGAVVEGEHIVLAVWADTYRVLGLWSAD